MKYITPFLTVLFLPLLSFSQQTSADNISTEKDTFLINEPFEIEYTFDGVYENEIAKTLMAAEGKKSETVNPVDSVRLRSSNDLEKVNFGSHYEMIQTNRNKTSTVKYCYSSKRSGTIELPSLDYYRSGIKYTVKGKMIFVKDETITSSDSLLAIDEISPSSIFNFPTTHEEVTFSDKKNETKVKNEIIYAKAGEKFKLSYGTNCENKNITFEKFDKKDFEIVSGPFSSKNTSIVNGEASYSETVTYELKTDKKGAYILGPFIITCGKKELRTAEVKVIVE